MKCLCLGANCYKCPVTEEQLAAVEKHVSDPPPAASPEFCSIAQYVMRKNNIIETPKSAAEGLALYEQLVKAVTDHDSATLA